MPQTEQIRERFLANARQHLLDCYAAHGKCHCACGQDSLASPGIEADQRSGKTKD